MTTPFFVGGGWRIRAGEFGGKPYTSNCEKLTAACWQAQVKIMHCRNSHNCWQLMKDFGAPWSMCPLVTGYPLSCKSFIQFCNSQSCFDNKSFAPCKANRIPESEKFFIAKSGVLGFGIRNPAQGSEILFAIEIRNPSCIDKESRIQNPESNTWNPESTKQNTGSKNVLDSLRGCLHDTGATLAPARDHSGSLSWLYICLHDITTKCHASASRPGVSPPRLSHRGEISLR